MPLRTIPHPRELRQIYLPRPDVRISIFQADPFRNRHNVLSSTERNTAINLLGATDTSNLTARAQALRQVAENSTLVTNEFNRAFVLMQFFGYLWRDPNTGSDADYTGYFSG